MPHVPTAPDVVIPCRSGHNPELRYALRSLEAHFDYRHIWVVGAWPRWLNLNHPHLTAVRRPTLTSKYKTTRTHYRWACEDPRVTDPWVLWNDDFYVLRPVHRLPAIHRGEMPKVLATFAHWTSRWAVGMRETNALMVRLMPRRTLYSYDIHTPLLTHKAEMLRALDYCDAMKTPAPHVRTLYGNLAQLGGRQLPDPKVYTHTPLARGQVWLSSHEGSFDHAVRPHLDAAGLTARSPFELPGMPDPRPARTAQPPRARPATDRQRRMRYRVLQTLEGSKIVPARDDQTRYTAARRRKTGR